MYVSGPVCWYVHSFICFSFHSEAECMCVQASHLGTSRGEDIALLFPRSGPKEGSLLCRTEPHLAPSPLGKRQRQRPVVLNGLRTKGGETRPRVSESALCAPGQLGRDLEGEQITHLRLTLAPAPPCQRVPRLPPFLTCPQPKLCPLPAESNASGNLSFSWASWPQG